MGLCEGKRGVTGMDLSINDTGLVWEAFAALSSKRQLLPLSVRTHVQSCKSFVHVLTKSSCPIIQGRLVDELMWITSARIGNLIRPSASLDLGNSPTT